MTREQLVSHLATLPVTPAICKVILMAYDDGHEEGYHVGYKQGYENL